MAPANPYDELPYRCLPVEWSAPERLALASMLHGGPRMPDGPYRVLELGCGDGGNLIPLAFHREHSCFVGIDGGHHHIREAVRRQERLQLGNLAFIQCDFEEADARLQGQFDFILAHGVFSWVSDAARSALFRLCRRRLRPGGLLYLNYNTQPGWSVRGMVRAFLLKHTAADASLGERARRAQSIAADVASRLPAQATCGAHPFVELMAREFSFLGEHDPSYVAHEYLAEHNTAFWRSDFLSMAAGHGLAYVADADFSHASGRVDLQDGKTTPLEEDLRDLLRYRQLHSPIFTLLPWTRQPLETDEFADLFLASRLQRMNEDGEVLSRFSHPSGYEVDAGEAVMSSALRALAQRWPAGSRVGDLFPQVDAVRGDLELLHRNGLVELRCVEPPPGPDASEAMAFFEREAGYRTTAYHTREFAGQPT